MNPMAAAGEAVKWRHNQSTTSSHKLDGGPFAASTAVPVDTVRNWPYSEESEGLFTQKNPRTPSQKIRKIPKKSNKSKEFF